MRQFIAPFFLFIPVLLLQTTIIQFFSIGGVVPDLILILLVLYALRNGQIFGTILGFIFGFLFDIFTGSLLGSAMLSKTLAGFTAGYFYNESKTDIYIKSLIFPLIVLLCAVIDSIIYSFFSAIDINTNIFMLFFEQGLLPGLYTAFVSIIVVVFVPKRSFV